MANERAQDFSQQESIERRLHSVHGNLLDQLTAVEGLQHLLGAHHENETLMGIEALLRNVSGKLSVELEKLDRIYLDISASNCVNGGAA